MRAGSLTRTHSHSSARDQSPFPPPNFEDGLDFLPAQADEPAPAEEHQEALPPHHEAHPLVSLDLDELLEIATLEKHVRDLSFIKSLRQASLDDGVGLIGDALERLRNPPTEILRIEDPDIEFALKNFLALEHSPEEAYDDIREAIQHRFQDLSLPTLYRIKQMLTQMSGVTPIIEDMCINSCVAYTGSYMHLLECPECHEPRHKISGSKRLPRAVFNTIPIGPQLQAFRRHPDTARKMRYRAERTEQLFEELERNDGFVDKYDDVFCGEAYLDAVQKGQIGPDDTSLMAWPADKEGRVILAVARRPSLPPRLVSRGVCVAVACALAEDQTWIVCMEDISPLFGSSDDLSE